jgi:hypothetical protein
MSTTSSIRAPFERQEHVTRDGRVVLVDVAELLDAWQDHDVQAVLRDARDAVTASRRAAGRVER